MESEGRHGFFKCLVDAVRSGGVVHLLHFDILQQDVTNYYILVLKGCGMFCVGVCVCEGEILV